ncbi:hypothetical protein BKA64DRAFT_713243 [Cadophora sp. MPI-SDFR-AT-0126]|nr:hypothetical protein BKA64DRAFT_713243 [Leotiomycetes sp. MPI-SDFR-AT-0126]
MKLKLINFIAHFKILSRLELYGYRLEPIIIQLLKAYVGMDICYHETIFFHACGHTEQIAQHASNCAVIGPTKVGSGLPGVDRHIVLLRPTDKSSTPGAGRCTVNGNCNIRQSRMRIWVHPCKPCSRGGTITKHPKGRPSSEELMERRRIWLAYFNSQTENHRMDKLREAISACEDELVRKKREAALQKHELEHEERKQQRKSLWFEGLARRHRRQIEIGLPAMKRTYVCPGTECLAGEGSIFQELDPASLTDAGDCAVCRLPLNDVDRRVAKIPCGHMYHVEDFCIVTWFQNGHVDCPYCRARFHLRRIPDWHDTRLYYPPDHSYPLPVSGFVHGRDDWEEEEMNCDDTDSEPESWYTHDDDSEDDQDSDDDDDDDDDDSDDVAGIIV